MQNLPTKSDGGGDDPVIKGIIAKWSAETGWIDREGSPLPPRLIAIRTRWIVRRWKDQEVEDITTYPLPNVDDLNEAVPVKEREPDMNGNPRPPYAKAGVVYLLSPVDAQEYTFVNTTVGTRICVGRLEERINNMRFLRGTDVCPIVEPTEVPMKTRYGQKSRPELRIVDWGDFGGPKRIPAPDTPQIGKPVEPVSLKDALDDEIPI